MAFPPPPPPPPSSSSSEAASSLLHADGGHRFGNFPEYYSFLAGGGSHASAAAAAAAAAAADGQLGGDGEGRGRASASVGEEGQGEEEEEEEEERQERVDHVPPLPELLPMRPGRQSARVAEAGAAAGGEEKKEGEDEAQEQDAEGKRERGYCTGAATGASAALWSGDVRLDALPDGVFLPCVASASRVTETEGEESARLDVEVTVLDVGCNSGVLTVALAKRVQQEMEMELQRVAAQETECAALRRRARQRALGAEARRENAASDAEQRDATSDDDPLPLRAIVGHVRVLGVDLDPMLISRAEEYWAGVCEQEGNTGADQDAQATESVGVDHAASPSVPSTVPLSPVEWSVDLDIRFATADVMGDDWESTLCAATGGTHQVFTVVGVFSVTMWIHLNHGDTGLCTFLRRVCAATEHTLLLEPQPWKAYAKAARRLRVKQRPEHPHRKDLRLRDRDFDDVVTANSGLRLAQHMPTAHWGRYMNLYTLQTAHSDRHNATAGEGADSQGAGHGQTTVSEDLDDLPAIGAEPEPDFG